MTTFEWVIIIWLGILSLFVLKHWYNFYELDQAAKMFISGIDSLKEGSKDESNE